VAALASKGEFEKMGKYCEMADYKPDYTYLLQSTLMNNPQGAVNIAIQIGAQNPPPLDFNTVADLFLQRNMIREATSFLLDVLKNDLPEQAGLQTKVGPPLRKSLELVRFLPTKIVETASSGDPLYRTEKNLERIKNFEIERIHRRRLRRGAGD
jgi:hypothetical protein